MGIIVKLRHQLDSQQPIQEVTLAGTVMVNGTDMAPLFQQFINPQPPAQPQPGWRG